MDYNTAIESIKKEMADLDNPVKILTIIHECSENPHALVVKQRQDLLTNELTELIMTRNFFQNSTAALQNPNDNSCSQISQKIKKRNRLCCIS